MIVHVPALIGVTVACLTVQIAGVLLVKVIGSPEELAIFNVKGALFTGLWLALTSATSTAATPTALAQATTLHARTYALRTGVNRHLSSREAAKYACLATAIQQASDALTND